MDIRVITLGAQPRLGVDVTAALDSDCGIADPDNGFRLADELGSDYAVLDIEVASERAQAVVNRLRGVLPNAKVIVATGGDQAAAMIDAVAARAVAYLLRPPGAPQLSAALIVVHRSGSPRRGGMNGADVDGRDHELTPMVPLSTLETEIMRRVARGETDQEIAAALYLSRRTVQNYLARVREKTGLRRRAELGAWAAASLG